MLANASHKGLISGLLNEFREGGIIALQYYVNDILLFSSCHESHLVNLKTILMLFERVSRMRINIHKSECVSMNVDSSRAHEIAHILSCLLGQFPLKYLGVSLHYEKVRRENLQPILDKLLKKMAGWRGRLLGIQ
jgi:hypothetical protein